MLVSLNIVLVGALVLLTNTRAQSFTNNPTPLAATGHGMRAGQTFTVNGHIIGVSQSHEHDDISMEVLGRVSNPKNVQNQATAGQKRPLVQPVQQGVIFSHDSFERHDLSLEDLVGRRPNRPLVQTQGIQQRPAVVSAGQGVRFIDDSIERQDLSLEDVIGRHANRQLVQTQTLPAVPPGSQGVRFFRDSDEHDDVSYEVDFSLLPELLRLMKPTVQRPAPAAPSQGQLLGQQVSSNSAGSTQRYDERHEASLEFNDILANPTFQQRIQEIDERLKRTPGARGKRLMEKYATALAVYSSPSNAANPSINSSYYLPFFIACFWAWFL